MAGRSRRDKIKYQIDKAIADIDRCLNHLMYAHKVSMQQHPELEKFLPEFILAATMLQDSLKDLQSRC